MSNFVNYILIIYLLFFISNLWDTNYTLDITAVTKVLREVVRWLEMHQSLNRIIRNPNSNLKKVNTYGLEKINGAKLKPTAKSLKSSWSLGFFYPSRTVINFNFPA